jgi:hypothetical protein
MDCCTSTNEVWYSIKSWTCLHVLFKSLCCFDEASKYNDGVKFRGYVGKNAEPLRVKLLNNVKKLGRLFLYRSSHYFDTNA